MSIQDCQTDLVKNRRSSWLLWGVPVILLIGTAVISPALSIQGVAWAIAFTVMGGACLANAKRCGRRHCFITGPYFILLAIGSLLVGFQLLPEALLSFDMLTIMVIVLTPILYWVPEHLWGQYRT